MAAPDLTVSIVNHRNRDLLLRCLAALEDDPGRRATVEVAVLDNASGDGSVEAVRAEHPDVTLLAEYERRGFGANHNRLIARTTGRHVLLLNDDAEVPAGGLDALVRFMDDHPRVGAAGPRIVYPDGRAQPSAYRFPTAAWSLVNAATMGRGPYIQSKGDRARRVDWASGCALVLRRDALDAVGTFDEGYFMYAEETDLCRRLADAGWETWYVPSVTVVHHHQASSTAVPDRRVAEQWRSRRRYWEKHAGGADAALARVAIGAQMAATEAAVRVAGRRRVALDEIRLHRREALGGPTGPGLRELAEAFNAERAAAPDEG